MPNYRIKIRSRHPSHDALRTQLPRLPFRSVVRLGSTTDLSDTVSNGGRRIECNTIQGVRNSSSKLLMKRCFTQAGVRTALWYTSEGVSFRDHLNNEVVSIENLPYPIIAKSHYGSRGRGNTKLNTIEEFRTWVLNHDIQNYIFEKFYTYTREYRLHISSFGCFYTCRKMIRRDSPEEGRWQRHDDNSVWILESNDNFDKPINWNDIVEDCQTAREALSLDIVAFDVKIQSATDNEGNIRSNPSWIILESCSAPSFGQITLEKYLEEIPKVLIEKFNQQNA